MIILLDYYFNFISSFSKRLLLNNFNLKAIVLFPQIFRNRIFLVFSENRIAFRLIFYQKESWIVAFHKHFLLFSWNSPSQKLSHFLTFSNWYYIKKSYKEWLRNKKSSVGKPRSQTLTLGGQNRTNRSIWEFSIVIISEIN